MKKKIITNRGFFLSLALSLLFNMEWTVPAWILLTLHFITGLSLWWFAAAILIWFVIIFLRVCLLISLTKAGNYKDPPKENKNPYSVRNNKD